ncbi:hypothetical protein Tco_0011208 [Tanacetum coccineum]
MATNSCVVDNNFIVPAAATDTVVREAGTADNTGHTAAEHNQVDCKLPALEYCKPQPYAQTLPSTCPSDMTAYTPSALSPLGISLSYPSYHTNPA